MRQKLLIVVLSFFSIASVHLVWAETLAEFSASYATGLEGMANARSWSPRQGMREGTVNNVAAGQRRTDIDALNVRWSQTAVNWINRAENFGRVSVTFHSFGPNNSCSTFETRPDLRSTDDFPGDREVLSFKRQCWSYPTEIRFMAKGSLERDFSYNVTVAFVERGSAPAGTQTFTFDTYYQNLQGNDNYHGNFCVTATGNTAQSCP